MRRIFKKYKKKNIEIKDLKKEKNCYKKNSSRMIFLSIISVFFIIFIQNLIDKNTN
jgi:hypothetical protein